ncbi:MAG: MarR family transcriptional regulator [Nisaea sp.]|jgi:DNA-binding MarR family transcriptional regulator|uniref:MarR family winged helix-turn-helix transcriptional regulator n=1 Tax=Nisaea sp. TaxID=2024842 RepID=UPI001B2CE236|nr:MarR family transcriptional regulator [Nisaea sp.]MBO6562121.1 MarR family transcriptional regulator [Nisaea sp.]
MQQTDDPVTRKTRLRLWLNLLRTTRFVENRLREDMRLSYDLTLPRFEILAMLQRSETGLRMTDLSSQLMVSNGNVTGIVDRLVEDGLVERVPVPGDKRASLVRLTYKGEAVFAEMADVHERWVDQLLSEISGADAKAMIERLTAVRKKDDAS